MGSMKFLILPYFVFGLWTLILCGCAQISSPTGGPIDEDPPEALKMSPASDEVNSRPASLRILFDEFVALKSPQQQLVISPPIATKPTFRIKGKEVRIELDPASFQDSTTYVFSFGKGIVDLHESNPAEDLNWAFSTGSVIDSLALKGRVLDRMTGKPMEGLRVLLFQEPVEQDSILSGVLPDAIGMTDALGVFEIDYLDDGNYFPLALDDLNSDYTWDVGEYLAFDSTAIAAGDSVEHILSGFEPEKEEALHYIESCALDSTGAISIYAPWDEASLKEDWSALFQGKAAFANWERKADSVMMWVDTSVVNAPEMLEVVWAGELFNDTSNVRLGRRLRRQWPEPLKPLPRSSSAQSTRELTFDRAVVVLDTSQWMLVRDGDTLGGMDFGMRNAADGLLSRNLQLEHEEADGSDYALMAFPGALKNPIGESQQDTLEWKWSVHASDYYGELSVALSNLPGTGWFIVQSKKHPTMRIPCSGDTSLVFSRLVPGSYDLGFEWDVDGDGTWQMGDFRALEVPEPYFYPEETPTIRSNWLVEWVWDFSKLKESTPPVESF